MSVDFLNEDGLGLRRSNSLACCQKQQIPDRVTLYLYVRDTERGYARNF